MQYPESKPPENHCHVQSQATTVSVGRICQLNHGCNNRNSSSEKNLTQTKQCCCSRSERNLPTCKQVMSLLSHLYYKCISLRLHIGNGVCESCNPLQYALPGSCSYYPELRVCASVYVCVQQANNLHSKIICICL